MIQYTTLAPCNLMCTVIEVACVWNCSDCSRCNWYFLFGMHAWQLKLCFLGTLQLKIASVKNYDGWIKEQVFSLFK